MAEVADPSPVPCRSADRVVINPELVDPFPVEPMVKENRQM
jgi:hypothetical protein